MLLYYTPTSPYGRLVRIVILEKGLGSRIELRLAQTRQADSPYYAVNPSGRVPYLVTDGGLGLEDSQLIVAYLDRLGEGPALAPPFDTDGWRYGRLETYARSLVDGLSVFLRETRRPVAERSPTIMAHEAARAGRLADHWEREVAQPLMQGAPNVAQLLLAIGLDVATHAGLPDLTRDRPALAHWAASIRKRASLVATVPPPKQA